MTAVDIAEQTTSPSGPPDGPDDRVEIRRGRDRARYEDYALPIWAGVVQLVETYGDPVPDDELIEGVEVPRNVAALAGRKR